MWAGVSPPLIALPNAPTPSKIKRKRLSFHKVKAQGSLFPPSLSDMGTTAGAVQIWRKEGDSPVNLDSTQDMKLPSDVEKKKKERSKPRENSMNMFLFTEPTYRHRDVILGPFNPSTSQPDCLGRALLLMRGAGWWEVEERCLSLGNELCNLGLEAAGMLTRTQHAEQLAGPGRGITTPPRSG